MKRGVFVDRFFDSLVRFVDRLIPVDFFGQEQMDSLHLLGATFVDKKRDLLGALNYWRSALEMKVIQLKWPSLERYYDMNCVASNLHP